MSTVLQRFRHLRRFGIGDGEEIVTMALLRRGVFRILPSPKSRILDQFDRALADGKVSTNV